MSRRLLLLALLAFAAALAVWPGRAVGTSSDEADAERRVEQLRTAATRLPLVGVVEVAWRVHGRLQRELVDVRGDGGALEAVGGGGDVVDVGSMTFVHRVQGWTSVWSAPPPGDMPSPAHHWQLSERHGVTLLGHPVTLVQATTGSGRVAERLYVDDATGLLLRREVLDDRGRVERSVGFVELSLSVTTPLQLRVPPTSAAGTTPRARPMPAGYHAPESPGAGFELVGRYRDASGAVQLFYSDGLFGVTVLEQRGALDWAALPAGGTTLQLAGHRTRRYVLPSDDVVVWERGGVVYTCVSDAPDDDFEAMVSGFTPGGRSTTRSVVDFVLGPFGW